MSGFTLNPQRQLIAAQCSGTLILAKLGLIGSLPACTDLTTKPWVIEAGSEWQCQTQRQSVPSEETALPQSLLFLRHYLQHADAFTLPGERVQWLWSRA